MEQLLNQLIHPKNLYTRKQVLQRNGPVPSARVQRIETLINEETLLLTKYIREENKNWVPRIAW